MGWWSARGATQEEISNFYTDTVNRMRSEPVITIIRAGTTVVFLQETSNYFVSVIMAFWTEKLNCPIEESFEKALGVLALQMSSDESMKKSGHTLFHDSITFHHDHKRRNKREAEKNLQNYRAIADERIRLEGVDIREYSKDILHDLERMSIRSISEKPQKVIGLGSHKVDFNLRYADHYFMALIMAYFVNEEKKSREEAFEQSLVLISMMMDGVELHRRSAGVVFKQCVEWHLKERALDFLKADAAYLEQWEYIESQIKISGDAD